MDCGGGLKGGEVGGGRAADGLAEGADDGVDSLAAGSEGFVGKGSKGGVDVRQVGGRKGGGCGEHGN